MSGLCDGDRGPGTVRGRCVVSRRSQRRLARCLGSGLSGAAIAESECAGDVSTGEID